MEFMIGWFGGVALTFLGMRNILKQQEGYTAFWYESSRKWMEAFLERTT